MKQFLLVMALMFAIAIAALDATVVSTALPTVVGNLGGLSLFSWVFSVYLLASTVTVPLYGKLADLYGRKPVLLFGIAVFLIGSVLCGMAGSMLELVIFRAVQGVGAGAMQPVTMTIIGDVFSIEQRARIQGLFSSVWGVTSLSGPAIGGLLADGLSWRWVFFINLPLGLIAMLFIWRFFQEKTEKQSHVIDYFGTVLLSGSVVALLLALLEGGAKYGWLSLETLTLIGVSALLLVAFIVQEGRAREPVLPMWLFRNKVIVMSCATIAVCGGLMFGVSSYVPLFAQGVYGGTAFDAGLIVLPMSFSWPVASVIGGRMILRFGYYSAAVTGGISLVIGALILLTLSRDAPRELAMLAALIVGFGMGFMTSALIISLQNAVEWRYRGVATGAFQFFRTIGGAISVAIMGALLNSNLAGRYADVPGVPAGADSQTLLNAEARAGLAADVVDGMQRALAATLHEVYFIVVVAAVIAFGLALLFPRGSADSLSVSAGGERGEAEATAAAASRARGEGRLAPEEGG
ncbi:MAG TPA: MDR family MFS transporter [Dehalococcoidia bacterium]|nr:MDR family MFS transporter [Dehalococcoidia bacterium]